MVGSAQIGDLIGEALGVSFSQAHHPIRPYASLGMKAFGGLEIA